ncbi:MAG: hypothetical protein VYB65_02735 [Myxococcota bacterium]|nr:hypothetical protein [Myxococcota bacterium]
MPIRPSHHRPQPSAGPARGNEPVGAGVERVADAGVRKVEDGFEKGSADPLVDAAMKRFARRTQRALGDDAMSMARRAAGLEPARSDHLTEAQLADLESAAVDLIKELPVRALSPELASRVEHEIKRRGLDVKDPGAYTLGNLGELGSEVAKESVAKLKKDHPGAYYGLAAGAAVGGAVYAYRHGSDALERLGIKPELTKKLGERTEAGARFSWGERLSDLSGRLNLSHRTGEGDNGTTYDASVEASHRDGGLRMDAAEVGVRHRRTTDRSTTTLSGAVDLERTDGAFRVRAADLQSSYSVTGDRSSTTLRGAVSATSIDDRLAVETARLSVDHRIEDAGRTIDLAGEAVASRVDGQLDLTSLRLGMTHSRNFDNGVTTTATAGLVASNDRTTGLTVDRVDVGHELAGVNTKLSHKLQLDGVGGITSGASTLTHAHASHGASSVEARYGSGLALESMSVGYAFSRKLGDGELQVKGRAGYAVRTGTLDASLSAGYTKEDLEIALTGGRNEVLGNHVGVGLKWSF